MTNLNKLLMGFAIGSFTFLNSCGVESDSSSELRDFEDVIKIAKKADGTYNVICEDGSVELGVTLEDLMNDKVCKKPDPDTNELPDLSQVTIETSAPRGSGCKVVDNKNTALSQILKIDEKTLAIATTFEQFKVDYLGSASGKRKFCADTIDLKIPEGWQVAAASMYSNGEANLPAGSNGEIKFSVSFQTSDGKKTYDAKKLVKDDVDGVFEGEFNLTSDDTAPEVWSECGRNFPLEVKTTLTLKGKKNDSANMSLVGGEFGEKIPTQFIALKWKKCK